jgi:nitrate reductase NapAB chaperone NapD
VALKNLPFAFYTSVEIVAHETTTLSALLRHRAPEYLNDIQKSYENLAGLSIMHTKATTKTGKLELVIASSFTKQEGTDYTFSHEDWDSNNHFMRTSINITKGQVYRLGFISSLISTAHHEDPVNEALRIVERGVLVGE